MTGDSFAVVGIDPGACAGVVVVRFSSRNLGQGLGRRLVPVIVGSRVIETAGMLKDPTLPSVEIERAVILFSDMWLVDVVGIEVPPIAGAGRGKRGPTYGAQRELIGAIRRGLLGKGLEVLNVGPGQAKVALAEDGHASKDRMVECLRNVDGWAKAWDDVKARREAKADAVGIALAAGRAWMKQEVGA